MQHDPNVALPRTTQEALELWNAGKPVPAFVVESEGAPQTDIWFEAFHSLQSGLTTDAVFGLTRREVEIINEIVKSAKGHGWAKMVQINLSGGGVPVMVTNPHPQSAESNQAPA